MITQSIADVIALVVLSRKVARADNSVELPLAKLVDAVLIFIDCGMASTFNASVLTAVILVGINWPRTSQT